MLVNIRLHDGVGLDVDGVASSVGLDAQGEVSVWVYVPEKTSKKPKPSIFVTESRVTCFNTLSMTIPLPSTSSSACPHTGSLDSPIRWKLGRDRPMKSHMGGIMRRWICGDVVQTGSAVSSHRPVGHRFARCGGGFLLEVEEVIRLRRSRECFRIPC